MKVLLLAPYFFIHVDPIKISETFNHEEENDIQKLSSLNLVHNYFTTHTELEPTDLQPNSIQHISSTKSVIFNEHILSKDQPAYIEVSYQNWTIQATPPLGGTWLSTTWQPISDCVTNYAGDKASYRQTWFLELDIGYDARLSYSGYFINFAPSFKHEFIVGNGLGGSYTCDVNPGNTLQFAVMYNVYLVDNVVFRRVFGGGGGGRQRLRFGNWSPFAMFEQLRQGEVQLACFTDERFLRCNTPVFDVVRERLRDTFNLPIGAEPGSTRNRVHGALSKGGN
ncbi:uncharacterized protein LODBEIA_P06470 [Lodderomyces beijingensis]|uniref:Uncharacterized protein n=1 Tax=Lodderomyces beijingensis TaxID=1775926 RepID=A0ABP0ZFS6_9ASCO